MKDSVLDGVLRVQTRLNTQLMKAGDAVRKAEKGLNAAIAVYRKVHDTAAKRHELIPTVRHKKLVNGVTKAREKLAKKLQDLGSIENDWKEYFRPL
jgi:hypothetical protein